MVENTKDLSPFHFIFFHDFIHWVWIQINRGKKVCSKKKNALSFLSFLLNIPPPTYVFAFLLTCQNWWLDKKNKFYACLWSPCSFFPKSKYSLEKEGNESVLLLNTFSCFLPAKFLRWDHSLECQFKKKKKNSSTHGI